MSDTFAESFAENVRRFISLLRTAPAFGNNDPITLDTYYLLFYLKCLIYKEPPDISGKSIFHSIFPHRAVFADISIVSTS
jgi:hypothetical protein